MIGNIIHFKLSGRHKRAVRKFARRVGAYNTKECSRLIVESLPEYQDDLRKVLSNTIKRRKKVKNKIKKN